MRSVLLRSVRRGWRPLWKRLVLSTLLQQSICRAGPRRAIFQNRGRYPRPRGRASFACTLFLKSRQLLPIRLLPTGATVEARGLEHLSGPGMWAAGGGGVGVLFGAGQARTSWGRQGDHVHDAEMSAGVSGPLQSGCGALGFSGGLDRDGARGGLPALGRSATSALHIVIGIMF